MRLLAIDGNSIVNRAFYGIRAMNASNGTPTNAIYGFFTMVSKIKREVNPHAVAVAFDLPQPTFRHQMYDEYKAGRHATPDDLHLQIALLKEMLHCFGIPVLEMPGYEADDILGTLAKECERHGDECVIYTGDRDSFQLVSDSTTVYLPKTGPQGTQTHIYTPQRIADEYSGLTPTQLIDVKALQGDSSDNIPGVPGIGPKTATMLIAKYGSLEKMYDAIEHTPESGKLQEKLIKDRDSAFFSQKLGTIIRDVPLGIALDDLLPIQPDFETVYDVLMQYDLKSLVRDWGVEPEYYR